MASKTVNMSLDQVLAALRTEREYQKRRWGVRQPDDSFVEVKQDVFEYLAMLRHYNSEAIMKLATMAGDAEALDCFRKVVALAFAALEQNSQIPEVFDFGQVNQPEEPKSSLSWYVLRTERAITLAISELSGSNTDFVEWALRVILSAGIQCFQRYGITPRSLNAIYNERDGRWAGATKP